MITLRQLTWGTVLAGLAVGALWLRVGTPDARHARHSQNAAAYFASGRYDEAEIEYLTVLNRDPSDVAALSGLGTLYFRQGQLDRSARYLLTALRRQPDIVEARVILGFLHLNRGEVAPAAECARTALAKDPLCADAALLLAESATTAPARAAARQTLGALPAVARDSYAGSLAEGILLYQENNLDRAQAAFERAATLDSTSPRAAFALGLLWRRLGNIPAAEAAFKRAAEISPSGSPQRSAYADFRQSQGDLPGALRILNRMTDEAPGYLPARLALAKIALRENRVDDASAQLARIFQRDPNFVEGLLLQTELELARGAIGQAREAADKVLKLSPTLAVAHFEIAQVFLAEENREKAVASLDRALALQPDFPEATVLAAHLRLETNPEVALAALEALTRAHPELAPPWLMLAQGRLLTGNYEGALQVCAELETRWPENPATSLWIGNVYRAQGKTDLARASYLRSLKQDASYFPALEQLVRLDVETGRSAAARAEIEVFLQNASRSADAVTLLAKIQWAQQDLPAAEKSFLRAIEIAPRAPGARYRQAQFYTLTQRPAEALAAIDQALALSPRFDSAWVLKGTLQETLRDFSGARRTYETLLARSPRVGVALNNLACLYSERFGELDQAHRAAEAARRLLPDDPSVADTLGWILYRKKHYTRALALLGEAAPKLPRSAEAQFHLGMAHYRLNQEDAARATLRLALQLNQRFPGEAEAQQCLFILSLDPREAAPESLTERKDLDLENDATALWRLAQIFQHRGNSAQASARLRRLIAINPRFAPAHLALARLYSNANDIPAALVEAKIARQLAPLDPEAALVLGQVARLNGDFSWSLSLLQEAGRGLPGRPDLAEELQGLAEDLRQTATAKRL